VEPPPPLRRTYLRARETLQCGSAPLNAMRWFHLEINQSTAGGHISRLSDD
jgi:hypothetical protein